MIDLSSNILLTSVFKIALKYGAMPSFEVAALKCKLSGFSFSLSNSCSVSKSAFTIKAITVFLRSNDLCGLRVGEYRVIPFCRPINTAACGTVNLSGVVLKYTRAADLMP
ncbi:hypothetical protein D9M68_734570 [compost metagenome]